MILSCVAFAAILFLTFLLSCCLLSLFWLLFYPDYYCDETGGNPKRLIHFISLVFLCFLQLTTNDLNTDQVAFISVGATTSSSSPYTSTTMSLKETSSFHGLTSSAAAEALKFNGGRKESEDRIPFSSYDDDSNTDLLT